MIKLNLLPPHINRRKHVKIAIGFVTVVIVAEVALLILAQNGPRAETRRLTADKEQKTTLKQNLDAVAADANTSNAAENALKPKYGFITGMAKYNGAYPQLYMDTAGYTYAEAMMLDLSAMQTSLNFHAYVSNPTDVARLMIGLTRDPDLEGLPVITGVPDFNSEEQKRRSEASAENSGLGDDVINGQIVGQEGASAGPGMAPGGMGGAMGPSGMGSAGMRMGGGGNSPGGGMAPRGMGSAGMRMGGSMMAGGGGNSPGGMGGGGSGGGGGKTGDLGVLDLAEAKKQPLGFIVKVTCQLKAPITRPSYADSEAQAGGSGGGGGGRGGMGGGGGGMGGGMGNNVGAGRPPGVRTGG